MLSLMVTPPISVLGLKSATVTSGANADGVITINAPAAGTGPRAQVIVLHGLTFSYALGAATGRIIVQDGATIVFDIDYTAPATSLQPFTIPLNIVSTLGNNIVVTIKAGGAAVVGKLNISYSINP